MKFNKKDLSEDIVSVIELVERLKTAYAKDNGTVVTFDGVNFSTTKIETNTEKQRIDSKEVNEMLDSLYVSKGIYETTFDTEFGNTKNSSNFKTLHNNVKGEFIYRSESFIRDIKYIDNTYYVLNKDGAICYFSEDNVKEIVSVDLYGIIKRNFTAVGFTPNAISTFFPIGTGFLVGTDEHGVYHIDPVAGVYDNKYQENNVFSISLLSDDEILLVSRKPIYSVSTYNITNGKLIQKNNFVSSKATQIPQTVVQDDNHYFVLGKNSVSNINVNCIHGWRKDVLGKFVNIDNELHPIKESSSYNAKHICIENGFLYISGIYHKKVFVWKYELSDLSSKPSEVIFDMISINYDDYLLFKVIGNEIMINTSSRVITMDLTGEIKSQFKIEEIDGINKMFFSGSKICVVDGKEVSLYNLPKYEYYINLDFQISSMSENAEISILMKTMDTDIRMEIRDEKNNIVNPDIYIISKAGFQVLKFKKKGEMKLTLDGISEDCVIDGIVVGTNLVWGEK